MAIVAPERGDVLWLSFDFQGGHEPAGDRPALALGPKAHNAKTGLVLCCPMTAKLEGYPLEVALGGSSPFAALADQVKSLDWRARKAPKKGSATATEVALALAKIRPLLGM